MAERDYQAYWDRNIQEWAKLYLDISHGHETLCGPPWFRSLYSGSIGRLERRLMSDRYTRTIAFMDQHVRPGTIFSDLGCGTGLFVVEALRRGAIVNAVDFAPAALDITRQNVARHCDKSQVNYIQADVQRDELPKSDVTLAMGLTPYLTDLGAFFDQALPKTGMMFCLYVDPAHWANRIRSAIPFLNVRGLQLYDRGFVDRLMKERGWHAQARQDFATGYIDLARSL